MHGSHIIFFEPYSKLPNYRMEQLLLWSMMVVHACKLGMFGVTDKHTWNDWIDAYVYSFVGLHVFHNTKMSPCEYCKGNHNFAKICKIMQPCDGRGKVPDNRKYCITNSIDTEGNSMPNLVNRVQLHCGLNETDRLC